MTRVMGVGGGSRPLCMAGGKPFKQCHRKRTAVFADNFILIARVTTMPVLVVPN